MGLTSVLTLALSQDGYANVADHRATPQDHLETQPFVANDVDHQQNRHQPHQHAAANAPLPTTTTSTTITNTGNDNKPDNNDHVAADRNSNTPVVSLLSIDQQQEKDYLSMQGGRRRKSNPPAQSNLPVHHVYPSNGYVNTLNSYAMSYHPQPPYGGGFNYHSDFRRTNGWAPRGKRKVTYERRADHSSRSSLRTDSNSSASYVDENKNESRTPPPAPYSPIAHQYKAVNTRNYHSTVRYNSLRQPFNYNNNNNNDKGRTIGPGAGSFSSNPTHPQSISQVHVTAGAPQGFVPQARRSRRSIRRSGAAGVSEIGAGDAPLPNDEVCKKFETLKL